MKLSASFSSAMLIASLSMSNSYGESLNVDLSKTTVSGLSSGGYMATQFHLSHADWVTGIGVIAAGPYYCAKNDLMGALASCINKQTPAADIKAIDQYIESQRQEGKLAKKEAIKDDKVWILHGTKDERVVEPVTSGLVEQYQSWLGAKSVQYVVDQPFSHHFPTENEGIPCETSEAPFIGNCSFDGAGEMLNYLIEDLHGPVSAKAANLHTFSQTQWADKAALGNEGYIYVPDSCTNGEMCTLHISFHGCNQYKGAAGVDDHYARLTGLNNWAEANGIVVMYPQTKASSLMPFNPQGCWDWWGYTNADYATKAGPQIKAVADMAVSLNGKKF